MKFGKTLRDSIIQEWRFYSVDYKEMKKALKCSTSSTSSGEASDSGSDDYAVGDDDDDEASATEEFFDLYEASKDKLHRFYADKEAWAVDYMNTLEDRVEALRETSSNPPSPDQETENESESDGEDTENGNPASPTSTATLPAKGWYVVMSHSIVLQME
jgi:SPX domain protein involved in polyphosphate accumulation